MKLGKIFVREGFTLIELVLSITILALVLVPFLTLFSSGYSSSLKARRITVATSIAEGKIEELRANTYQTPRSENKTMVDGVEGYQQEVVVHPAGGGEGIWQVTVNVYWLEKEVENKITLTTYFAER